MEGSFERAFGRLDLDDASAAQVAAHPAAFVDKPLPSPPPAALGGSTDLSEGSSFRYCEPRTDEERRPLVGQLVPLPPGFGLPRPPSCAPIPPALDTPGRPSTTSAVAPPSSVEHQLSIGALGSYAATPGPSTLRPTRKELLNARFVAHATSCAEPARQPAAQPSMPTSQASQAPPDYSVFDPVSPGLGHSTLPWATRPLDRHPQQPSAAPPPPPLPPPPSPYPMQPLNHSRQTVYPPHPQSVYPPNGPAAYEPAAAHFASRPTPLPLQQEPYSAQPYYHHPAAVVSPSPPVPPHNALTSRSAPPGTVQSHHWVPAPVAWPPTGYSATHAYSATPTPAPSTPQRRPSASASSPAFQSTAGIEVSPSATRQCAGFTQKGARCRNRLKQADGDGYCHVHAAVILNEVGFYLAGGGRTYVLFSDWIPPYLEPACQVGLRVEMERPLTLFDKGERGFIYAFEYRGLQTADSRMIKIGLSRNPIARLDQWAKQCPSHDPLLLGVVPTSAGVGNETDGARMRGVRRATGEGMPGAGRLERLVHLEIGGMVKVKRAKEDCVDCKKVHQELFPLPRLRSGREWEDVVLPVMRRWERFVRLVAAEPGHG